MQINAYPELADSLFAYTPATASIILKKLSPQEILDAVKYSPNERVKSAVARDVENLLRADRFNRCGLPLPEAPVSPSGTSCETSEGWISAKEAAEILGKGPRMVSNYRAAGDITGRKKDGRTWEYDAASVEEFALQLQLKAA
ncbi:helix-turn-helix domain-containing protein [Glutamicibacter protophormiae]|uniref:helix-turn-helix domain-containing protein n=1 Tax=Glutamicibacter protophormiae TaxID=37930 RepID=UPI003A93AAF0